MTLRAFIVEDNPTILRNLIDTLSELADVTTVGSAETESDGLQWLKNNAEAWDIAVVDIFLREGCGLGVLANFKKNNNKQKIVVLSNYSTPDIIKRCIDLKVDAVFDKSNEIDSLVQFCMEQ